MDRPIIPENPHIPPQERPPEISPEFQSIIRQLKEQIHEDATLQEIDLETLTVPDFNAWKQYIILIKRLSRLLNSDAIDIETQKSFFDTVLNDIYSKSFLLWMRNRIELIKSNLSIVIKDPEERIHIQNDINQEIERFR